MTHEKLLGYTAAQLKAMTTADLEALYGPVLNITRPDQATKPQAKPTTGSARLKSVQSETMNLLKQLGMKLDLGQ